MPPVGVQLELNARTSCGRAGGQVGAKAAWEGDEPAEHVMAAGCPAPAPSRDGRRHSWLATPFLSQSRAGAHPDAGLVRLVQQVVQPPQRGLVELGGRGLRAGAGAGPGQAPGSGWLPAGRPQGWPVGTGPGRGVSRQHPATRACRPAPAPSPPPLRCQAPRLRGVLRVDGVRPGAHHVEAVGLALGQQVSHQLWRGGAGEGGGGCVGREQGQQAAHQL